jgi:hypothetical protein
VNVKPVVHTVNKKSTIFTAAYFGDLIFPNSAVERFADLGLAGGLETLNMSIAILSSDRPLDFTMSRLDVIIGDSRTFKNDVITQPGLLRQGARIGEPPQGCHSTAIVQCCLLAALRHPTCEQMTKSSKTKKRNGSPILISTNASVYP